VSDPGDGERTGDPEEDAADAGDGSGGDAAEDPENVEARLEAVESYLAHLGETNPYYEWLGASVESVERGRVVVRQPYERRLRPPEVGPPGGINGGVVATLADAAAMAAVVAEALEPTPLATVSLDLTFHEGVDEDHLVAAEVVDFGSTLATARIDVRPASERDAEDPTRIATGEATARLFDGD